MQTTSATDLKGGISLPYCPEQQAMAAKTGCSFKEYVSSRFHDEFYNAAYDYLVNDLDDPGLYPYWIEQPLRIEMLETEVRTISVNDLPGSDIEFNVVLVVFMRVFDSFDLKTKNWDLWLMLSCAADLAQDLDDMEIYGVHKYDHLPENDAPLSDALVPIISRDDMDEVAERILAKYYPAALQSPTAIDPARLADSMGLRIISRSITEDYSIFGQIFFEDCDATFFDRSSGHYFSEFVHAGTICIDQNCRCNHGYGKLNNTIIHECVHWELHRKAHELERLCSGGSNKISCQTLPKPSQGERAPLEWMEWQANSLAPRIQMPLVIFESLADRIMMRLKKVTGKTDSVDIIEDTIDALADHFQVSRLSAKIRMIEAGYEEAAGAFVYVDSHYVRPTIAQPGTVGINQTFTISRQDAFELRRANPELRELTGSGDYLFVENHFVYNTPLYVERNRCGELQLTHYARTHMDECCLAFNIERQNKGNSLYQGLYYLNREPSNIRMNLTYCNGWEYSTPEKQIGMRKRVMNEWRDIRRKMTDDPRQCMDLLLSYCEMTKTELCHKSGVSERTIRRAMSGERQFSVEHAVRICLAMQLPPIISEKLLVVLQCPLNPLNERHVWMKEALTLLYMEPLSVVVEYLSSFDVKI